MGPKEGLTGIQVWIKIWILLRQSSNQWDVSSDPAQGFRMPCLCSCKSKRVVERRGQHVEFLLFWEELLPHKENASPPCFRPKGLITSSDFCWSDSILKWYERWNHSMGRKGTGLHVLLIIWVNLNKMIEGKHWIRLGSCQCCLDFMGGPTLGRAGLNSKALETGGSWILDKESQKWRRH